MDVTFPRSFCTVSFITSILCMYTREGAQRKPNQGSEGFTMAPLAQSMLPLRVKEVFERLVSGESTIAHVSIDEGHAGAYRAAHVEVYLATVLQTLASGCTLTALTLYDVVRNDDAVHRMVAALGTHRTPLRTLTLQYGTLPSRSVTPLCDAIAHDTWSVRKLDVSYSNCHVRDVMRLVRATLSPSSRLTELLLPIPHSEEDRWMYTVTDLLQTGRSSLQRIRFPVYLNDRDTDTVAAITYAIQTKRTNLDTVRMESRVTETLQQALCLQQRRVLYRRIALRRCLYHR